MFNWLEDHPFIFGAFVALVFLILVRATAGPEFDPRAVRNIGLIVFGTSLAWLMYRTRDASAAFRFFLGGSLGVLIDFLMTLQDV